MFIRPASMQIGSLEEKKVNDRSTIRDKLIIDLRIMIAFGVDRGLIA